MIAKLTAGQRMNRIIEWEGGNLSVKDFIELFSHLVSNRMAWSLQGMYGRQAMSLIEAGMIEDDGTITQQAIDEYWENDEMLYDED